jgi:hypothetical protein
MFAYSPRKGHPASQPDSVRDGGKRLLPQPERFFTVESANRLLPLVCRVAGDLILLDQSARQQSDQLRGIEALPAISDLRLFSEELASVKDAFRADGERLDRVRAELASLGVEVDSLADAAFDFPAFRDQRPVRLCWRMGESEVGHWHEVGESFHDRQPL